MASPRRARCWSFTVNNFTDKETETLSKLADDPKVRRLIVSREVGESGTPHYQGAVSFREPLRFAAAKTKLGGDRVHLEASKGTWAQNVEYCTKTGEENVVFKKDVTAQGTRTDLIAFKDAIKEGMPFADLLDAHPVAMIKHLRAYDAIRQRLDRLASPAWRDVRVEIHWGDTGTGKTRMASEAGAFLWSPPREGTPWWDGYNGDEVICIDEFYGQMPMSWMLKMCDGYRHQVPVKGAFAAAQWTTVYITSNSDPMTWWEKAKLPSETRRAFARRVTSITHYTWERDPFTNEKTGIVNRKVIDTPAEVEAALVPPDPKQDDLVF
jgi:hypothetical protein